MKRAAQYLRMSTDKQRYSIEAQMALIGDYAAAADFEIVRTYKDEAKSGVTIAGREGLKCLLKDVMTGAPFEVVLVLDVSRWGRYQDPDQAAHYEFICREAGVSVRYCAEPFDDDGSPTSSIVKSIKRVMAAEYSRQLSDRCRASLRRHMLAGGKCGGHPPYGFARQIFEDDGRPGRILAVGERRGPNQIVRLVRGPAGEVATVRMIFHLFANEMMGASAIAHYLNARGIPYRRPGPWDDERVGYVLSNEIATGVYAFNRTTSRFGKATPNAPSDWIRLRVAKPIISRKLFEKAQNKRRSLNRNIWTDEEMIGKLRLLLKKHGFITKTLMDRSEDVQGVKAYERRFGSVDAAWALVPYVPDRPRRQHVDRAGREPDEIIRRLRALYEEKGYLNLVEIQNSPRLPSIRFIYQKFGSLGEAYRAAGIDMTRGEMMLAGRRRGRRSTDLGRLITPRR